MLFQHGERAIALLTVAIGALSALRLPSADGALPNVAPAVSSALFVLVDAHHKGASPLGTHP